jgi:hypothetical protein
MIGRSGRIKLHHDALYMTRLRLNWASYMLISVSGCWDTGESLGSEGILRSASVKRVVRFHLLPINLAILYDTLLALIILRLIIRQPERYDV